MRTNALKAAALLALACGGFLASQIATASTGCTPKTHNCPRKTTTTSTTSTRTTTTSTTTTTTATTTTTTTPTASALPYRYTFDTESAAATAASYGWNLADVGGKYEADQLPAGTKGLVWVGNYDNTTCSWEVSDATLRATVQEMVGDPHVFGYFFSDEPYAEVCPNAPAQHAARNALIKSIDPSATTVIVLNANGSTHRAAWPLWSTPTDADYIGINPYPCLIGLACDWALVTNSINAADAAGFRYWFVVQSFADYEYRFPTATELQYLLGLMKQSRAQGMMTFAWTYSGYCLCDHPDLLSVWNAYNHS